MGTRLYSSPARTRVERDATRRTGGSAVITTVLSLLVVVAAVAVVAYLVLRTPSSAVDSAERLEPVGTALPAPTEPPALPTVVPTTALEPESPALGFTGEAPAVAGLPTVAAPVEQAGPTPTPRVIAQPTAVPPTPLPAVPTLPPSVPVSEIPVVALQPVEAAPAPAPTPVAAAPPAANNPALTPAAADDDPFNIFDEGNDSRIVPVIDDPVERVRSIQEQVRDNSGASSDRGNSSSIVPGSNAPRDEPAITARPNDQIEVVVPDVDAMIDEITAQALNPNRNPNVGDAGRRVIDANEKDNRPIITSGDKRKSARDRIKERTQQRPTKPGSGNGQPVVPIVPQTGSNRGQNECNDPFANLPDDRRPAGFPKC